MRQSVLTVKEFQVHGKNITNTSKNDCDQRKHLFWYFERKLKDRLFLLPICFNIVCTFAECLFAECFFAEYFITVEPSRKLSM